MTALILALAVFAGVGIGPAIRADRAAAVRERLGLDLLDYEGDL